MELTPSEVDHAIEVYQHANAVQWPLPAEVTRQVLAARPVAPMGKAMADVASRYLGRFDTHAALARHVAAQSYPEPMPGQELASVDFNVWPFRHINWVAAGDDLASSLETGTLAMFGDRHYFDMVDFD